MNVSAWSYGGRLLIGVQAYAEALTDPDSFVRWLGDSLSELAHLARPARAAPAAGGAAGAELAS